MSPFVNVFLAIKNEQPDSESILFDAGSEDVESQHSSRRELVGRRKGSQPKRKAAEDLSENVHTKRSRLRLDTFTEGERALEMAKKADISAVGYCLRVFKPARNSVLSQCYKGGAALKPCVKK